MPAPKEHSGHGFSHFFFFQAEDGIRGGHVTGVQTCALPISMPAPGVTYITPGAGIGEEQRLRDARGRAATYEVEIQKKYAIATRSEERRVGKERRLGWLGEQYKEESERIRGDGS